MDPFQTAMNLLRRGAHCVFFYVLLLHLGAMCLTWSVGCWLAYPLFPQHAGTVMGRAAISWIFRNFWVCTQALGLMRIDFAALDVLNRQTGLIIAANHPSMLDAMLLVARARRGICIMRASLLHNPCLGGGARLARYICNDPPKHMIRSCVSNLQAGAQLVMFPEGTRTINAPINPFRPGLTLIAHLAQVPIQTVIIETDSPYLGKHWPIWRLPQFPVNFRVRLGQRFEPQANHLALLAQIEAYFVQELST